MNNKPTPYGVVIIEHNDRILFLLDAKIPHCLKLPGGKSEAGETNLQTAIRELNEELGLVLQPEQLKRVSDFEFRCDGIFYGPTVFRIVGEQQNWPEIVVNREPEECCELVWVDKYALCDDILLPVRQELARIFAQENCEGINR